MSVIATALKHLMAAGLTGDALVAAIEEIETEVAAQRPVDTSAAHRRERDRIYQAERRAERRRNRQTSAESADSSDSADLVSQERHSTLSSSEPEGSSEMITPRPRKADKFPCPEGVDPSHWRDLLANRKTKRLTNTPTAYRALLADLAKFADDEWPPGRVVEFAASRGWGAIFDPRKSHGSQNDRRPNGMGRHQPDDGLSSTLRAANRAFPDIAPSDRYGAPG